MKYTTIETTDEVTLAPAQPPVASAVLLHGLGADGWDFVPIVAELGLPERCRCASCFRMRRSGP